MAYSAFSGTLPPGIQAQTENSLLWPFLKNS